MTSALRQPFPSLLAAPPVEALNVVTRAGLRPAARRDWLAPRALVIARSLFRTLRFDLSAQPEGQRRAALRGQILAWSPFERNGLLAALKGDTGLAFAWDQAEMDRVLPSAARGRRLVLLPEFVLQEPMQEGLRLQQGLEGFEAQQWHAGMLVASRWWPALPDAQVWADFGRETAALRAGLGLPQLPAAPPAAVPARWRRRPWLATYPPEAAVSGFSRAEQRVLAALGCGMVALTAMGLHQVFDQQRALDHWRDEQTRLREAIGPALTARDQALQLAGRAAALEAALRGVQPLELLTVLAQTLPARGVVLKELDYNNLRLVIGLELAPEVQRSQIVQALQSTAWFNDVKELREAPGRNWSRFDMQLNAVQAPSLRRPAADTAARDGLPAVVPATAPRATP